MSGLRILAAALAVLGLSLGSVVAASPEAFPTRPIKIIVPTPAGGPVDVIARLVGNYLASSLGQAVVIDNRPGAGNTIGSKEAAQADAQEDALYGKGQRGDEPGENYQGTAPAEPDELRSHS